ncbi:MAG: TIM-barrel domain-containing protein, partial [Bacteroidota bacterium]
MRYKFCLQKVIALIPTGPIASSFHAHNSPYQFSHLNSRKGVSNSRLKSIFGSLFRKYFHIESLEKIAMLGQRIACCVLILFCLKASAMPPGEGFVQTKDGIIIYPNSNVSGGAKAVKLQVITDKIIRITASPLANFPEIKSLITVSIATSKNFTVTKKTGVVLLKTPSLTASILLSTGAVSFFDKNGNLLLNERQYNGRRIEPAVFEGQNSYGITQTFETTASDAYYGLGQHQDGIYNYKGSQVLLFQNNTEVAVPFLISHKNYGLLWDNYSLTKVGDTREYLPLSVLKLYSKDGNYGWLTASYNNDKNKPDEVAFTKAESKIDYPWLDDSKKNLPQEFNPAKGCITWEGSVASDFDGLHKFFVAYAGACKVWVDGKLLVDRWRQSWNPGSSLLNLDLQKGKKYPIKIRWSPDGGESYLSVKWLNPLTEENKNAYSFSSEAGRQLDYYFIKGNNMDEVIAGYRHLTGKATIVPKWAMGFWQSRERYKTQEELSTTAAEFRKRNIPIDAIVQDWSYWKEDDWGSQEFDASRFPSPGKMIADLHKQNMKFMISVWPKFYEGIPAYKDFEAKGWLYKRNIADRQKDWIAKGYISTFYEAFNDEAKKGFWDLINKKLYSKGVDAWWMDASEPDILSNVSPEKRKAQMSPTALGIAAEYLNAYPLENAKGIFYGQRSVDKDKRVFLLTRSGFAGSQHYGATIWSGDISSTWGDMKTQISAGLNFSMSGIPFWTMDIGGFAVHPKYEKPDEADLDEWRELQTRWYQFGALVPLFRSHGPFPYREVFHVAPENHPAYKSMIYYNQLRYRMMPYLYTIAGMTHHNNYTVMRGLVMDFPKDTAVKNIGDQYMFGPSLLVAPVYAYKERNKRMYLPSGQGWYDIYAGGYVKGGQHVTVDAPYERMPLMVKEGSILPFGPALQYTDEKKPDTITLYVYTGKDASFKLYEDENTNYNYEKGAFSNIAFNYSEALKQLTIGKRGGNFPGMLMSRTFRVVWVTQTSPRKLDFTADADKT